jgi:pimeloyl-ACP methyl ester carboxylesterase
MNKVISKDGTEIAYDKQGQGPSVILVDGALAFQSFGPMPELAKLLSPQFTGVDYDKRGVPAEQIEGMRKSPMWPMFEAEAPTLLYDAAAMGQDRSVPIERLSHITAPALVMHGGAGQAFMKQTALSLCGAIPNAEFRTIEGQTHAVASQAIAPVLAEFLKR